MRPALSVQTRGSAKARSSGEQRPRTPRPTTLLELVQSIGETTPDDREVVATVLHLLRTRQVRLCGILRGLPVDDLG